MKRKLALVGLVVAVLLFSVIVIQPQPIVEDEEVLVEDPQPIVEDEEVLFEDVRQGSSCGVSERLELKITDLETWEVLWDEMERGYIPVDQTPRIDFSTTVLFVVFQGVRNTGGYVTNITRIVLTATEYVVFIDELHPGSGCIVTMAETQPYHIVVVTSSSQNLPVQFVYNITTYDCGP